MAVPCSRMMLDSQDAFRGMRASLERSFKTFSGKVSASARDAPRRCYGRLLDSGREPSFLNYAEVADLVRATAACVQALAVFVERETTSTTFKPRRRPFVALAGGNALEWVTADLACSGLFLPTVGLHPQWDSEKLSTVLKLTGAAIAVSTSLGAVAGLTSAGGFLRHVVVLDATLFGPGGGAPSPEDAVRIHSATACAAAAGIRLWVAAGAAADPPCSPQARETVPEAALERLAAAVAAALPGDALSRVPVADADGWAPLFPEPDAAWLAAAAAAEEAAQAAHGAPLFAPLVPPSAVAAAGAQSVTSGGRLGAAGWALAASRGGCPEARFDLCSLWSIVFATGSSGALKGVPTSRAAWASGAGAGGSGRILDFVEGNDVLSHSALSHGLDRGMVRLLTPRRAAPLHL